jgi:cellulose synthase/poly-beta-1,6-N-acetylglucosamine synthase-like glycosyltransferase
MSKTLAVVVIGRNEGRRLSGCLQSIRAMDSPCDELIYADSASTDDSIARATRAGVQVIALPRGSATAARGRNAGWRAATSEYVLFLDGDTVLDPHFVSRALEAFEDPMVAVVWGHRRELYPHASVYNRVLDLDWIYKPGVSDFCGGDALMRRSVLEQLNGYDEQLVAGEEPEMCARMRSLGYTILHTDCPMTGHDLDVHYFHQYWRRAVRAGFAYAAISQRFRGTAQPLWRRDARRNLVHGAALTVLPLLASLSAFALHSVLPLLAIAFTLLLLIARTAHRVSWKSSGNLVTQLLYAVHSHLQQIPILVGQIRFYAMTNDRHRLIEYKGAA